MENKYWDAKHPTATHSPNEAKEILDMFEFLGGSSKVVQAFKSVFSGIEELLTNDADRVIELDVLRAKIKIANERIETLETKKRYTKK